jgi:uncharacterized membrane protein
VGLNCSAQLGAHGDPTRRLSGFGLMALTVAVTPAHIFVVPDRVVRDVGLTAVVAAADSNRVVVAHLVVQGTTEAAATDLQMVVMHR